jgi:hypothetical protein
VALSDARTAERAQARLFAETLRTEAAMLTDKVAKAELSWRLRHQDDGDLEPPDRIAVVQGRIAEIERMIAALRVRFP